MGINNSFNGLQSWSVLVFLDPETGFIRAGFIKRSVTSLAQVFFLVLLIY